MSKPFRFVTSNILAELTGRSAANLKEFVEGIKAADESTIFTHTHMAFKEFHFARGIYTNDFSRWVAESVQDDVLAEKLAAIDITDFTDLLELKKNFIKTIEDYLGSIPMIRSAPKGEEFHFYRNIGIISLTAFEVWDLEEFKKALKLVGPRSIFYHFFESRLRLKKKTNDFSAWIEDALGKKDLAQAIEQIDPYVVSLDELADKMIAIIDRHQRQASLEEIIEDKTFSLFARIRLGFVRSRGLPIRDRTKLFFKILRSKRPK